ncbi:MAG: glucose-1-phosphate cytidylyltransferase [Candidatus Firestonebacteria bacterium]|nr:glucose-1-phosphate cytidylyltransferase [Candidatus Firestonebacteria bacterium]
MKVVILAGGKGTRISEETQVVPKPMIEIGGKPILWHIMKTYSHYGYNEFVICLGYLGYMVKEYFSHYFLHLSDLTIDLRNNEMEIHNNTAEPWKVTLVETGPETMTGGRLKRIQKYVGQETFMLTYGDGVGNVNIPHLLASHKKSKNLATLTAVQNAGRFGIIELEKNNRVKTFVEKPMGESSWINGGFFVLEPEVFSYIKKGDAAIWEREPLEQLAKQGELNAFRHLGFWKPMDTLRDKLELEKMWNAGQAPWKVW